MTEGFGEGYYLQSLLFIEETIRHSVIGDVTRWAEGINA